MNKIIEKINTIKQNLLPKFTAIDAKIATFLPNAKLRKVLYYTLIGLFGFMFLIIILGIVLMPFRRNVDQTPTTLNKPNITILSPKPEVVLNETQKKILDIENKIKDLKFPESILTLPSIESDIKI